MMRLVSMLILVTPLFANTSTAPENLPHLPPLSSIGSPACKSFYNNQEAQYKSALTTAETIDPQSPEMKSFKLDVEKLIIFTLSLPPTEKTAGLQHCNTIVDTVLTKLPTNGHNPFKSYKMLVAQ
jgi:hypothetical protein